MPMFWKNVSEAYLKHDNLADATRHLANALGPQGLVITRGQSGLETQFYSRKRRITAANISQIGTWNHRKIKDYNIQVNPREINLFYIEDELRERIVLENGFIK
jgi:hypothetical protein